MKQAYKNFLAWVNNDWIDVRVLQGIWNINVTTDLFGNYKESKTAIYRIKYSKIANRVKLVVGGYRPYEHLCYPKAVGSFQDIKNVMEKINVK